MRIRKNVRAVVSAAATLATVLHVAPAARARSEEPEGTWWNMRCYCIDVTATQPVSIEACFIPPGPNNEGLGLTCGLLAFQISGATRLGTRCVQDPARTALSDTGQGPCVPTTGNIRNIRVGQ